MDNIHDRIRNNIETARDGMKDEYDVRIQEKAF